MDNSSIVTFFSPSLHNYMGGPGPPGPSPSYSPVYKLRQCCKVLNIVKKLTTYRYHYRCRFILIKKNPVNIIF